MSDKTSDAATIIWSSSAVNLRDAAGKDSDALSQALEQIFRSVSDQIKVLNAKAKTQSRRAL